MSQAYEQAEYDRWPSGDCRTAAMLGLEPEEIESHFGVAFRRDVDGLDYHRYAWVRLASGRQVLLIRYEGNQFPGTEVLVDARDDRPAALRELLDALGLPDDAVTWTPESVTVPRSAAA